MNIDNILFNYNKSLMQKYNALCLDIDGTITKNDSKEIDERVIGKIAEILKKGIPVVFITGRGETGLDDLKKDILPILKKQYFSSEKDLKRMYALINDGARLYKFNNSTKEVLGKSQYVATLENLNKLNNLNDKIIKIFKDTNLNRYCKHTYSIDSNTNFILNIRIVLKTKNEEIVSAITEVINQLLKNTNSKSLNVTRGIYVDNLVLQIGTTKKDQAIKKTEQIIGIPENSMIRIGDCGDLTGNDFSMLDCPQGFSVDKISEKDNCCFPVINKDGKVLKGVDATLYLLDNVKLLRTICLEKANREDYRKKYSLVEKQITEGRKKHFYKYDELINKIFKTYDGMESIFDADSGSIKIPMYEWELIENENPLKKLWSTSEGDKLYYSLRDDENYLLRGSKVYYYFLATRANILDEKNQKDIDITTKKDIVNWYENNYLFFNRCVLAVEKVNDLNEIYNKKMILGILDNIRNYLLISINYQIEKNYDDENALINFKKLNEKTILYNLYDLLLKVDTIIKNSCFQTNYLLNKKELTEILLKLISIIVIDKQIFKNSIDIGNYSKQFRAYREIDNFAENYVTVMMSLSKEKSDIAVCGLCYGGIELPIIYKIANPDIEDITMLKFNKNASGYSKKQSLELRFFDIKNYGGIKLINIDKSKKYILMDDNLLTGKTMQLAINTMYDLKIDVNNLVIVRYPSINRVDQMFMKGHGAIDYNCFFDYIKGLCFPSPYSWRDENLFHPYEDSLGVFDLNRRKIIQCLLKNHDYKDGSEVYKLKRRYIHGRNN